MPKGKEEKVEETIEVPEVEEHEGEKPEAQTPTFTQEEHDRLKKEALDEQYRKLNKSLVEQGQEIRKLRDTASRPPASMSNKAMRAMLEEMERPGEGGEPSPRIAQLRQQLDREEQLEYQGKVSNEEWQKMTQKIFEANLNPSDEMFDSVIEAWEDGCETGTFEKAHRRLDRILDKTKPVKFETSEPEGDKLDKLIEERARKMLEDKGLLTSDTAGPSASSSHYEDLRDRYVVDPGSLSPSESAEYLRLRAERGVFNP